MITAAILAAAAAVLLWPSAKPAAPRSVLLFPAASSPPPPAPPAPPPAAAGPAGFRDAIDALAVVRGRLTAVDPPGLTDAAKSAIDTLTLALVAGSDR